LTTTHQSHWESHNDVYNHHKFQRTVQWKKRGQPSSISIPMSKGILAEPNSAANDTLSIVSKLPFQLWVAFKKVKVIFQAIIIVRGIM
jgi:hypothetical protein